MKKLPPTLLLALGLEIVATMAFALWFVGHDIRRDATNTSLLFSGANFASAVLAIVGVLELARRTTGRETLGLRISAIGFALGLGLMGFWLGVQYWQPQWQPSTYDRIGSWGWFAADVVPLLGLVISTSQRHRTAALVGVGVLCVGVPVPPLAHGMYGWIGGWKAAILLQHTMHAGVTLAILALASQIADGEPPREPDAAAHGLRTISTALWLRVISAVTVAGISVLLVFGSAGEGGAGIVKLAMMAGAVVGAIALVMVARGALGAARSGIADLSRWPLVVSAAGTLWCLGIGLYQLPYVYRMLYGTDYSYGFSDAGQGIVQALSVPIAIVGLGAVAVVGAAINGFATRRGLDQLRAEAQAKTTAFVGLMLAYVALQSWVLPKAESRGGLLMMTVAAAVAMLWATAQMARLCTLAADSLHAEPPLPKATVL